MISGSQRKHWKRSEEELGSVLPSKAIWAIDGAPEWKLRIVAANGGELTHTTNRKVVMSEADDIFDVSTSGGTYANQN
jgi:hypothetical protein